MNLPEIILNAVRLGNPIANELATQLIGLCKINDLNEEQANMISKIIKKDDNA